MDFTQKLGELPSVLEPVLNKISLVPEIRSVEEPTLPFDQLTVSMHIVLERFYAYFRLPRILHLNKTSSFVSIMLVVLSTS